MKSSLYTIDAGNSDLKIAYFENGKLVKHFRTTDHESFEFNAPVIFCSVRKDESLKFRAHSAVDVASLRSLNSYLDMPIHYSSTLGADRYVAAYEAWTQLDKLESCLVVDLGTFVTADLVTQNGFMGGFILPGPVVISKAFEQGEKLKELAPSADELKNCNEVSFDRLPGDTKEAMKASWLLPLIAFLEKLCAEHNVPRVLLTGGLSSVMKEFFNPEIEVLHEPDLVHQGLLRSYQQLH